MKGCFLKNDTYLTLIPRTFYGLWNINAEDDARDYAKPGEIVVANLKFFLQRNNYLSAAATGKLGSPTLSQCLSSRQINRLCLLKSNAYSHI